MLLSQRGFYFWISGAVFAALMMVFIWNYAERALKPEDAKLQFPVDGFAAVKTGMGDVEVDYTDQKVEHE